MGREDELKARLAVDRGDPVFAELADLHMAEGRIGEALTTLLAGLSSNPHYHVGRLVLARLFLHLGYTPFAVREIEALRKERPDCESLVKLLEAIAPGTVHSSTSPSSMTSQDLAEVAPADSTGAVSEERAQAPSSETTLAEGEFEIDILEQLEEKKS